MLNPIIRAKDLVHHGKVISINDKIFEVEDNKVSVQKKPGRTILTCSCWNATAFCNEGICIHKIAVLLFLADQNFYKKIDKLIEDYKRVNNLKMKIDTDMIIYDLESLRRVK